MVYRGKKIPNLNRYCFQKLTLLFGISTIDRKLKEGALHIFAGTDQDQENSFFVMLNLCSFFFFLVTSVYFLLYSFNVETKLLKNKAAY